jgi:hypothetical protein
MYQNCSQLRKVKKIFATAKQSNLIDRDTDIDFIEKQLDLKVKELITKHKSSFAADPMPLISNPGHAKTYIANYYEEYLRFKKQLSQTSTIL